MKTLITILLAGLACVACTSPAQEVDVPQPQLPVGASFEIPCNDPNCPGPHTQTVVGTQLVVLYEIRDPNGQIGYAPESNLMQFLEMYGIVVALPTETE